MAQTKANKRTDFWNWAFESTGRNPLAWQASAKDLLEGAEAVKDRVPAFSGLMPTLASVQALLLGLALECLLKALWIKSHKAWLDKHKEFSLTRNGEYVGIPNVNDHDLLAIANAANLKVTSKEKAVLARLSGFGTIRRSVSDREDCSLDATSQDWQWTQDRAEVHYDVRTRACGSPGAATDGRSGALEITILKPSGAVAAQSSARVTGRTPVVRQLAEEEGAARAVR